MKITKQILVVDDVHDWRRMLTSLLGLRGYRVSAAGSIDEALGLFAQERFHLAVLDIRLDERDEDNVDGLHLLRLLKADDPSLGVIMLTGHANVHMVIEALEFDEADQPRAFAFVEKDEIEEKLLPEIDGYFRKDANINEGFTVNDPEEALPGLTDKLKFRNGYPLPREALGQEVRELFGKLFRGCDQVTVRPLNQGYSGSAVVLVVPHKPRKGSLEAEVAKFGERCEIEGEAQVYEHLVHGAVGGHRVPSKLVTVRTRFLAGLIYSFAGGSAGKARDFATLYRSEEPEAIEKVVDNVYRETCFCARPDGWRIEPDYDLTSFYQQHLRLTVDSAEEALRRLVSSEPNASLARLDDESLRILGRTVAPDPVHYAASQAFHVPTLLGTIHGDLNGWNILVDRHSEAWLIDFGRTCEGPLLQDFASLETFIKYTLLDTSDLALLYEWESALTGGCWPIEEGADSKFIGADDLAKALRTIRKIRSLACAGDSQPPMLDYYIVLLYQALKEMNRKNLTYTRQAHALISGALLCRQIAKWMR